MTCGRGGWFTVPSVIGYLTVLLSLVWAWPAGGLPRAEAEMAFEPAAGLEHAVNLGDDIMALRARLAKGRVVYCGFSARPIPPFEPDQTPEFLEDTGPSLFPDQDPEAVIPGLDACGAGVGAANLLFFWALCALGLGGLCRGRPIR